MPGFGGLHGRRPPHAVRLDGEQGRPIPSGCRDAIGGRRGGDPIIAASPQSSGQCVPRACAAACRTSMTSSTSDADRQKRQHGLEPDRHLGRRPCPGAEIDEPERCCQAGAKDEGQGSLQECGLVHRLTSLRAAPQRQSARIGRLTALPPPPVPHGGEAMAQCPAERPARRRPQASGPASAIRAFFSGAARG